MGRNEVYFGNHGRALKFPWSIYHSPLINALAKFLQNHGKQGDSILIIGPGDLPEMPFLEKLGLKVSILDIDERVLTSLKVKYGDKIVGSYLVDENFGGYPAEESFELIYAKEVIEHFQTPSTFIQKIFSTLRRGGRVWLSTPNYGFFLLPLLEKTILELIARLSGFSRKDIHPSRFSLQSFISLMRTNQFDVGNFGETKFKLALWLEAQKS